MTVNCDQCKSAFSRLPSGVVIITAAKSDGTPCGATVSSFSSLTLEPPMAYFAMFKASRTLEAIRETRSFSVHIVEYSNRDLAFHFASKSDQKFDHRVAWEIDHRGVPVLGGFNIRLDCHLSSLAPAGDHQIATCLVEKVELDRMKSEPAAWFMRDLYELQPTGECSVAHS